MKFKSHANLIYFSKENTTIMEWWKSNFGHCRLLAINDYEDLIRIILESILAIGALLYLLAAIRELGFLGLNMFIENLVSSFVTKFSENVLHIS